MTCNHKIALIESELFLRHTMIYYFKITDNQYFVFNWKISELYLPAEQVIIFQYKFSHG